MIKPSIGRVVWFKDNGMSNQFMPALICYVWSDDMVNLVVFDGNGIPNQRTSVPLFNGDSEDCPDYQCCWMPYQKGQAAKAEALEKQLESETTG